MRRSMISCLSDCMAVGGAIIDALPGEEGICWGPNTTDDHGTGEGGGGAVRPSIYLNNKVIKKIN